jgi:hypothetical protein
VACPEISRQKNEEVKERDEKRTSKQHPMALASVS